MGFKGIDPSTQAPALAGALAQDSAPPAYLNAMGLPVGLHVDRRGERGYGLSISGMVPAIRAEVFELISPASGTMRVIPA
jgi:hypothetical protein